MGCEDRGPPHRQVFVTGEWFLLYEVYFSAAPRRYEALIWAAGLGKGSRKRRQAIAGGSFPKAV